MDTDALVENQIDSGQALLTQLAEVGIDVSAACWVRPAEDDRWTLYLSTPLVDQKGPIAAYSEVLRVLRSLEGATLTASDISLVGENHPITGDVLSILRRHSGLVASRAKRSLLGGAPVEEVYVYPAAKRPAPHTELTEEQKRQLEELYNQSPLAVDELPYTAEMDRIHDEFVRHAGVNLSVRDVFKALKNLGRQGRLGGKVRSPAQTGTSSPPTEPG